MKSRSICARNKGDPSRPWVRRRLALALVPREHHRTDNNDLGLATLFLFASARTLACIPFLAPFFWSLLWRRCRPLPLLFCPHGSVRGSRLMLADRLGRARPAVDAPTVPGLILDFLGVRLAVAQHQSRPFFYSFLLKEKKRYVFAGHAHRPSSRGG
nr:hypothetical protein [Pandoravirus belohorizontensis]